MTQKKSVDYPFLIVLLFVISIGGYWIIQEIRSQNLNPYLDYLESRLLAVIPQNEDKDKVQTLYEEFKTNVRENKIAPEEVEEVAAEILNLTNVEDSISFARAEELFAAAIPPAPPKKFTPEETEEHSGNNEKWRELNEKLKSIYEFEEGMRKENIKDRFRYQFNKDLQIVADRKDREDLVKSDANKLILSLDFLEKEKLLLWTEDVEAKIQYGLDSAIIIIETMQDSIKAAQIKAEEIRVIEMRKKDSLINQRIRESRSQRARTRQ